MDHRSRNFLASLISISTIFCCCGVVSSYAEESNQLDADVIQLEGLTFECPDCYLSIGDNCELQTPTDHLLMKCDELVEHLLTKDPPANLTLSDPSAEELMNYLLTRTPSISATESILRRLLADERGKFLVISAAEQIALRYGGVLGKLIKESSVDRELARSIWNQLSSTFAPPRRENLEFLLSSLEQEFAAQGKDGTLSNTEESSSTLPQSHFTLLSAVGCFLVGTVIGVWWLGMRRDRRLQINQLSEAIELTDEDRELEQILTFFNLGPDATERDLARVYRMFAKELHPDRNSRASVASFSEVHLMYRRARSLLKRRRELNFRELRGESHDKNITRH